MLVQKKYLVQKCSVHKQFLVQNQFLVEIFLGLKIFVIEKKMEKKFVEKFFWSIWSKKIGEKKLWSIKTVGKINFGKMSA